MFQTTLHITPLMQLFFLLLTIAGNVLFLLIGIGEGRRREAAEPSQCLCDDEGDGIGVPATRRHV